MDIIVQKFGGTSVASPELIMNAAKKAVAEKEKGYGVVIVVSAMGKTTDQLIELAEGVSENPSAREMDMLLTTGEQVTISLMAMALHTLGHDAISLTGHQVEIMTDKHHGKAKILDIDSKRMERYLNNGKIIIVAGFQGITSDNEITTLGRGGSDTTAVALASALHAKVCDIYTDVTGVFTADPRVVHNAKKLKAITYDEMLELASVGANVLHSRSVEFAKKFGVKLQVRSSFFDEPGTFVMEEVKEMENVLVSGVACNKSEAKISVLGLPDQPGLAAGLFEILADAQISIDMIIQNVAEGGKNDITYTVEAADLKKAIKISKDYAEKRQADNVIWEENIAKVSAVGVGMKSHSGVASKMFSALAAKGINIQMISTSEIKISCIISIDQADVAVKAIHDAFVLSENIDYLA